MKKLKMNVIMKGSCMCHGSWTTEPIEEDVIISNDKYFIPMVFVMEILESITTLEEVPGSIELEPVE